MWLHGDKATGPFPPLPLLPSLPFLSLPFPLVVLMSCWQSLTAPLQPPECHFSRQRMEYWSLVSSLPFLISPGPPVTGQPQAWGPTKRRAEPGVPSSRNNFTEHQHHTRPPWPWQIKTKSRPLLHHVWTLTKRECCPHHWWKQPPVQANLNDSSFFSSCSWSLALSSVLLNL